MPFVYRRSAPVKKRLGGIQFLSFLAVIFDIFISSVFQPDGFPRLIEVGPLGKPYDQKAFQSNDPKLFSRSKMLRHRPPQLRRCTEECLKRHGLIALNRTKSGQYRNTIRNVCVWKTVLEASSANIISIKACNRLTVQRTSMLFIGGERGE